MNRQDCSPDSKLPKLSHADAEASGSQNEEEPFKPPYVPELFVGFLKGLEGEEGMSILVSSVLEAICTC